MEALRKNSVAVIISTAIILSTIIAAGTFAYVRKTPASGGVVSVTGSRKKEIRSDYAVWRCEYSAQAETMTAAYAEIRTHYDNVRKFLIDNGISDSEIRQLAVNTYSVYERNYSGYTTNRIEAYNLSQVVEVRTKDVDKVFEVSKRITELIDKGINISSYPAQYFYTQIAELRVEMIALATQDAKDRAEKIAENSGAKITGMKSAKAGVFQITPLYSNEISDYGINDTSSIDKEIMAVMNCEFKTR